MAIAAAGRVEMQKLCVFLLRVSYGDLNRVEGTLASFPLKRVDAVYENDVRMTLAARESDFQTLADELSEKTGGRADLSFLETRYDAL